MLEVKDKIKFITCDGNSNCVSKNYVTAHITKNIKITIKEVAR